MKKIAILLVLAVAVVMVSGAGQPGRYRRAGPVPPTVCNRGDRLRAGRCWKPCGRGWSIQWNNWRRCQRNCRPGEKSIKGRCYTRRCIKGYRPAGNRCWSVGCPRGYVPKSVTQCWRPCPRPYVARGHKCVNPKARPGQCDSYTRPSTNRASRPFIVYPQATRPRPSYVPRCRAGYRKEGGRCRGLCKKGFRIVGDWCKNNRCWDKNSRYRRCGPHNPTVCRSGGRLRAGRCWRNCPKGYHVMWNNFRRCQKNCAPGEKINKGRCYTRRCIKGYHRAGNRCYANNCPRGYVPMNAVACQRPCPRPYVARGRKCVNPKARPGQCDSYTRPSTRRASRPFIVYPSRHIPRANYGPSCPRGKRMERGKCRCLCKPGFTIRGDYCRLSICIGI